ncbi:hypothetical protein ACFWPX_30105 [Nocardia sp. NPDC058518]|uniref:hypothetical protein n=1 Tax=Nocardia sp. NPDC058518 TaxID=3346534 RepID=UPI003658A835
MQKLATITTTQTIGTEPAPGVRWLNWTLRATTEHGTPAIDLTGRHDELREYLVRYVHHATEGTLTVRWSEPHSSGYAVTDADNTVILNATMTAIESNTAPRPMHRPHCCATPMQPARDPARPDTALLVCTRCNTSTPEFP